MCHYRTNKLVVSNDSRLKCLLNVNDYREPGFGNVRGIGLLRIGGEVWFIKVVMWILHSGTACACKRDGCGFDFNLG